MMKSHLGRNIRLSPPEWSDPVRARDRHVRIEWMNPDQEAYLRLDRKLRSVSAPERGAASDGRSERKPNGISD
jgi:hypothetical protein